jgi:predicted PurR-regulated permease PerM
MEDTTIDQIFTFLIIIILIFISFLIVKPILLSIIFSLIFAFIFYPLYQKLLIRIKNKNISAGIVCLLIIIFIGLIIWLLVPIIIEQSIKIYIYSQETDFIDSFKKIFPLIFESEIFLESGPIFNSFFTKITNSLMNYFGNILLNLPTISLHLLIIMFIFFFALRDGKELVKYIENSLPFQLEIKKKILNYAKDITNLVVYGQILIGILQGLIVSISFFIFKVPNALFLSFLAILAGIFPIIGTSIIWIPVVIYFLFKENLFIAIGISIFGIISTLSDNFIRPVIISKKINLNTPIILIGMVGGLFLFGLLGLILGPLILSYLFILLDLYKNKIIKKNE